MDLRIIKSCLYPYISSLKFTVYALAVSCSCLTWDSGNKILILIINIGFYAFNAQQQKREAALRRITALNKERTLF